MRGEILRDLKGNYFIQRVVLIWSELLEEATEADAIGIFKRYFDRYMDRNGLEISRRNVGQ